MTAIQLVERLCKDLEDGPYCGPAYVMADILTGRVVEFLGWVL